MCWSFSRMSRYVAQSKYLEQLKNNEELCIQAYKTGKYLMFSEGKPLINFNCDGNGIKIKLTSVEETQSICGENLLQRSALLGIDEDTENTAMFATNVTSSTAQIPEGSRFSNMRTAIFLLSTKDASIVGRGHSLLNWLQIMKYCPTCTNPLTRNAAGTMLKCGTCAKGHHYPIPKPVAITRVEDPTGEKVLLVRQSRHPPGMYSCIAGFIEPGESLEEAVRREIAEEAGIVVGKVEYFDSQTWPLPQDSLMLGCYTKAMPGAKNLELDIDKEELQDAKWFTKAEVQSAYERIDANPMLLLNKEQKDFIIPPKGAIAHSLLKTWLGL